MRNAARNLHFAWLFSSLQFALLSLISPLFSPLLLPPPPFRTRHNSRASTSRLSLPPYIPSKKKARPPPSLAFSAVPCECAATPNSSLRPPPPPPPRPCAQWQRPQRQQQEEEEQDGVLREEQEKEEEPPPSIPVYSQRLFREGAEEEDRPFLSLSECRRRRQSQSNPQ